MKSENAIEASKTLKRKIEIIYSLIYSGKPYIFNARGGIIKQSNSNEQFTLTERNQQGLDQIHATVNVRTPVLS